MQVSEPGLILPILFALSAIALASAFFSSREVRRLRWQLAAERQRTELVIRATQTGIFDWDVASNRIDYSERFKEILGFPLNADLSDRTRHFDNVHPEDRERARAAFVAHLREGRDRGGESMHPPIEYRLRRADGGYTWVRGTGLSLRSADGRTLRYIASIIDISERKRHELEQQNQAKFIGDLFDSMPLSLAFRDMQGCFRMVNRTWEQYFGFSREQTLGRTPADLAAMPGGADASEVARIAAEDRRALDLGPGKSTEPREIVLRGRHRLHSRHFLQSRTAMGDAQGNLTGVLITGLDATAQHEMQQVLETQRQRLELVVKASQAGIVDWDGVTRKGWYSDRLKALLGYPPDTDTSAWTFFDRLHIEDRESVRASLIEHLKGGNPASRDSLTREFRMLCADGSYIWVQSMGLSLRDASGRSARFLSAITDISDRRAQEEAVRTQEQRLALVVRAAQVGIIDWDATTRTAWHSERLKTLLGYAPDTDTSGWPDVFDLIHAEDRPRVYAAHIEHLTHRGVPGGESPHDAIEYRLRCADGSYRWVQGIGLSLCDQSGRAQRFIAAIADISERRAQEEALRTQQQRLELVVRAAQVGIIDGDTANMTAWFSDGLKEMLGYVPDADTSAWTFLGMMHPEDRARVRNAFVAHLKGIDPALRDSLMLEYRMLRADGSPIWVQGMALSLRDKTGRSVRFLAAITDISERRAQEEALRDQVKLTRDLIDANPNPVYLKDERRRFVEINAAYAQLTGLTREQCLGRGVLELYPPDLAEVYDRQDRELLARGDGSTTIEVPGAAPVGSVSVSDQEARATRYLMSKSILKRADGTVRGLVGALTDITELKRAEQVVRESEERMRFWLENIPIPIAIYDPEGGVQFLNSAFVATFGWTLEEMRGKRMPFVPEQRREQLTGVLHKLLTVGKDAFETERMTKDGRILDIYVSTGMALTADGKPRATMVSLMDVTERKRMERELQASREEALQAAQAKAAFLAAMSHEIRTPLNGVLGMAGLLADTVLTEEQHEYVDTIRVSGDALLSVINDILDFSKIESGRMEVESAPFEPMRAVEEALEILGERARSKRLELAADAEDSVPAWVLGDFARLRQVLVNLVGNAVKFTERGEVVVRLRAPRAGSLEIEVSDTGVGIAKDRLAHLFEAFTQADASTTRRYGGTGLGLAISKRLVELMGGDLRADSEPGRGSTFVFNVSVISCEAPSAAAAAEPVELAGRRILIVDDNATNLRILRRQLERWGAVPVAASGGPAALALLDGERPFDAALLDYHMPDMDGVMLARRIKAQAKSLPLLLLSSSMYRRAEEAEAGLFVVQLLKPVRQQQLREALVSALGGAGPMRKSRDLRAAARVQPPAQLRILVVDDVDANCRLAQALLRKFGHVSEVATSGLAAVEMAATGRFDVVLMDVQMPDIDGMDATQRIRERLGAASPRVIAVTANAMPGDRERCLAAGMDDYLSKPIQHWALRAAIELPRGAARPAARAPGRTAATAPAGAIDWRRIESLDPFDVDGSMVAGAIASFLGDAPGRIRAIREAHAAGDAAGLAAAAHALKGAAANVGAAQLQALSQDIESAAREARLEDARKPAAALEKALAAARAALAKGRPSRR